MNTIKIKHGTSAPTVSNLVPFELGYVKGGALYINNDGTITQLTGLAATGLVNANSYLKLPVVASTTSNTGRILVADSTGIVYYKTPANILSEIGALSTSGGTISGNLTANGAIIVKQGVSYGNIDPNIANSGGPLSGTTGQLYFVITG